MDQSTKRLVDMYYDFVYTNGVKNFTHQLTNMLKSLALQRPAKIFDPADREHREMFYTFLKTWSWTHCPYVWLITDDSTDVVHYIQKKLTAYYMDKEFAKSVVKTRRRKSNTKLVPANSRKKPTKKEDKNG